MSKARRRRNTHIKHNDDTRAYAKAHKIQLINRALEQDPVDVDSLRRLAVSPGGLVSHEMRRRAWPKLVGSSVLDMAHLPPLSDDELKAHRDWRQVLLDVNRCYRRFPKDMRHSRRRELHGYLMHLIMNCLCRVPTAYYYQGFHDIAACWLITIGEDAALAILLRVARCHLMDLLDSNFERLKDLLSGLFLPIIASRDKELAMFLEKADAGIMFCLPWVITWFSHDLDDTEMVTRIHDLLLASHPLMPVYLSAAVVIHRRNEVLQQDCDFVSVHALLGRIPQNLPFDELIHQAVACFRAHPPQDLASLSNLRSLTLKSYTQFLSDLPGQQPDRIIQKQLWRNHVIRERLHGESSDNSSSESAFTQRVAKAAVWGLSASLGVISVIIWTQAHQHWL